MCFFFIWYFKYDMILVGDNVKVIFLDFDGVINNWNRDLLVDFENVKYLLEIIKVTGAKIVATTSNKYTFQAYEVDHPNIKYYHYIKQLKEYGIDIFDITPLVNLNRELEIKAYLDSHSEIEEFLILDDDYIINGLIGHQVFLDLYNGVCEEHVVPAINILNGKLGFYPPNFNFLETQEKRIIKCNKYHSKKKI